MKQKRLRRYVLFLFLSLVFSVLFLTISPSTRALALQSTPSDDEVNAIAKRLFCPVCENTPLDVCDTEACQQWRSLIRQMLAEGKTEAEITQYFAENYGIRVLSEPPVRGFNWLAYLVPPAAFLLGAYLLFRAFRIWKRPVIEQRRNDDISALSSDTDSQYATQFENEMKKRR